jgi:RNA polymerase sigma-70 factor (ECF subfamily)
MSQSEPLDEAALCAAVRRGDEEAFKELVSRNHAAMLRVAMAYCRDHSVAEEVTQDTWLAVLRGLEDFEGRSSLRTWIFRILVNRARTRAQREARSVAFSRLGGLEDENLAPEPPPERFRHPRAPGHWTEALRAWDPSPEDEVVAGETRRVLEDAIAALPPTQRAVVTLRDVEDWSADEVCNALGLSAVHQRVLLHRARLRLRRALEAHLTRGEPCRQTAS